MTNNPRHKVPFRRRREGKTDYRARLALIKSQLPRAVVRRSLKNIKVQLINYRLEGDEVVASATTAELKNFGWTRATCNLPSAYMVGFIAGKRALGCGIGSAVLDIGLRRPTRGNRSFAALKGMTDAGILIPHGEGIIPADERIRGAHMGAEQDFERVMTSIREAFP